MIVGADEFREEDRKRQANAENNEERERRNQNDTESGLLSLAVQCAPRYIRCTTSLLMSASPVPSNRLRPASST